MFKEYYDIQFILHCLITKTEDLSAQTTACKESFATKEYEIT